MRKKLRTLTVLAFLVCCFLVIRDMDIQPTEAPVSGAALVESMLEKKAGKTAERTARFEMFCVLSSVSFSGFVRTKRVRQCKASKQYAKMAG